MALGRRQAPPEARRRRFCRRYRAACEQLAAGMAGLETPAERRHLAHCLLNRLLLSAFVRQAGWCNAADPLALLEPGRPLPPRLSVAELEASLAAAPWAYLLAPEAPQPPPSVTVPTAVLTALLAGPDSLCGGTQLVLSEQSESSEALDPELLGTVHEELSTHRSGSGSYYTPRPVVSFMCREALKCCLQAALPDEAPGAVTALVDRRDPTHLASPALARAALRRLRCCDPACGGGAFLIGLLHELLGLHACLDRLGPSTESLYERTRWIVERNLRGVDLDPVATGIARVRLWLAAVSAWEGTAPPPRLAVDVAVGDSLLSPSPRGPTATAAELESTREGDEPFNWGRRFAEVFAPGEQHREPGFDCLVTNPPYLSTKRGFGRGIEAALRRLYTTARGQYDAYGLFIERGLELLTAEGGFAFIVPKPLLTNSAMAPVRRLLERCAVTVLALPDAVFGAAVETVILAGSRRPAEAHAVSLPSGHDLAEGRKRVARFAELITPAGTWVPQPARLELGEFEALRRLPALGSLFRITRGEECGKRDSCLAGAPGDQRFPLLRGEDVGAFAPRQAELWLDRRAQRGRAKPLSLYQAPNLLVRRVANDLTAAIDRRGCHVLNTLYVLQPCSDQAPSLEYTCAALNSPALNAYFRAVYLNDDRLFPYLRVEQLRSLPLALPTPDEDSLATGLVSELEALLAAGEVAAAEQSRQRLAALVLGVYHRAVGAPADVCGPGAAVGYGGGGL